MPLDPLPPNNTDRLFIDYNYITNSHSFYVRYDGPSVLSDAVQTVENFLAAIEDVLDDSWVVTGARVQAAGTNFTIPTTPPLSPTPGGGTVPNWQYPRALFFGCRDFTEGRKGGFFIYGATTANSGNFRYEAGEIAALDNGIAALGGTAGFSFQSIGGHAVDWRTYVNVQWNSFHERNQR